MRAISQDLCMGGMGWEVGPTTHGALWGQLQLLLCLLQPVLSLYFLQQCQVRLKLRRRRLVLIPEVPSSPLWGHPRAWSLSPLTIHLWARWIVSGDKDQALGCPRAWSLSPLTIHLWARWCSVRSKWDLIPSSLPLTWRWPHSPGIGLFLSPQCWT